MKLLLIFLLLLNTAGLSGQQVIISECMPDPTPARSLPEAEYIELFNRSKQTAHLKGWTFGDRRSSTGIPETNLEPGGFLVLCPQNFQDSFSTAATVISFPTWPSLNNTSDLIWLADQNADTVDWIEYPEDFNYREGFSIEIKDPESSCGIFGNWSSSLDNAGGTPGRENSWWQNANEALPEIIEWEVVEANRGIQLTFSAYPDWENTGSVRIQPEAEFESVKWEPSAKLLRLTFRESLNRGISYLLLLNYASCSGNSRTEETVEILIPDELLPGDIIINEILFEPGPGGSEFIELVNISDKNLNTSGLWIGNNLNPDEAVEVEGKMRSLFPGEYILLAEDTGNVRNTHVILANALQTDLPSLPNSGGTVVLFKDGLLIDQVNFEQGMHHPILQETRGVSLERIHTRDESLNRGSWISSASRYGATPGYINTAMNGTQNLSEGMVTVEPEVLTPDFDGSGDYLLIRFELEQPGWICTAGIYNLKGERVQLLSENKLMGKREQLLWFGLDRKGQRLRTGIYVLIVYLYNQQGHEKIFKKIITLANQF